MDYTAKEFSKMVCDEIDATVAKWHKEAADESMRGAANQAMIGALNWGAERMEELKARINSLPVDYVSVPSGQITSDPPVSMKSTSDPNYTVTTTISPENGDDTNVLTVSGHQFHFPFFSGN